MRNFFLQGWPESITERQAYVDPIFANIAPRYDFMTNVLSCRQERRWKKQAISFIEMNDGQKRLLDLATGTGDFPFKLREAGFEGPIIGVDRNASMLSMAIRKQSSLESSAFVLGDLMQIPFKDGLFDVTTMGYGLRYVADIRQTLREVFRLLHTGGLFVCLDFGLPRNRVYRHVCFAYLLMLGTMWSVILHGNLGTYWHIVESLRSYPGQMTLQRWMHEAGFRQITLVEKLGGIITIFACRRP